MPVTRTLNQHFFKTWTPEMAYVLGFFAADGCMIENARTGQKYVEFKSVDKSVLEAISRAADSSYTISAYERGGNCRTCYRVQITCETWFTDLESLGFTPRKSRIMQFPDVPAVHMGAFVRGYFDGDGCVYFKELKFSDRNNKRRILMTLFTSGSLAFLKSLKSALIPYGVTGGHIRHKERGYDLKFSHRDSLALYTLMYNTVPTTDLYLPREYELFREAIKTLYPSAVVA